MYPSFARLQLAGAEAIEDVFSLCFGGVEGNGALMLGDVPPATFNVELQYTPLVFSAVHPHYYLARLQNDGTILPVDQVRAFEPVCVASESCLMMSVAWGLDRLLASMLSTLQAHACK